MSTGTQTRARAGRQSAPFARLRATALLAVWALLGQTLVPLAHNLIPHSHAGERPLLLIHPAGDDLAAHRERHAHSHSEGAAPRRHHDHEAPAPKKTERPENWCPVLQAASFLGPLLAAPDAGGLPCVDDAGEPAPVALCVDLSRPRRAAAHRPRGPPAASPRLSI